MHPAKQPRSHLVTRYPNVHKRRSECGERPTAAPQSLRSCAAQKEDMGSIPAATSIFLMQAKNCNGRV